jgi:integrase
MRTGWAKAGLANFTFHDVRHTYASRLVMAGVDFPTVKELMDPKDITMTLRYTLLFPVMTNSMLSGRLHGLGAAQHNFSNRPCRGCCYVVISI